MATVPNSAPAHTARETPEGTRSSREDLRCWYSDGLRSKLAQAVVEGRVDARRANELHRLMTQLLEDDGDLELAS